MRLSCWPCDAVFLVTGDGVWTGAFAHAIYLHHRHVQAHEVLQSFFGDGGSACEEDLAAVQAQRSTHLLKDHIISHREAPWHLIFPVKQKKQSDVYQGHRLSFGGEDFLVIKNWDQIEHGTLSLSTTLVSTVLSFFHEHVLWLEAVSHNYDTLSHDLIITRKGLDMVQQILSLLGKHPHTRNVLIHVGPSLVHSVWAVSIRDLAVFDAMCIMLNSVTLNPLK